MAVGPAGVEGTFDLNQSSTLHIPALAHQKLRAVAKCMIESTQVDSVSMWQGDAAPMKVEWATVKVPRLASGNLLTHAALDWEWGLRENTLAPGRAPLCWREWERVLPQSSATATHSRSGHMGIGMFRVMNPPGTVGIRLAVSRLWHWWRY